MPVMNGVEATAKIREFEQQNHCTSPVPIIGVSGIIYLIGVVLISELS